MRSQFQAPPELSHLRLQPPAGAALVPDSCSPAAQSSLWVNAELTFATSAAEVIRSMMLMLTHSVSAPFPRPVARRLAGRARSRRTKPRFPFPACPGLRFPFNLALLLPSHLLFPYLSLLFPISFSSFLLFQDHWQSRPLIRFSLTPISFLSYLSTNSKPQIIIQHVHP